MTASLGGVPSTSVDVPITAIFLILFLIGAATHMAIFQMNKRKGHKFLMSGMCFGFCMARTVTCILRIAWATRPTKIRLAIAAMIFVSAGVVLLFIINLIFAQRITRARHPSFGWHRAMTFGFRLYYATIVLTLIILITCAVQSFYTLNQNTHRIDRDVQLYGGTFNTMAAFFPIPLILFGLMIPRNKEVDKFGVGRFRTKIWILLIAATALTIGASFRVGVASMTPRPRSDPAWYHSKACFYVFNFAVEIIVVYLYAILRVDMRFHVPNGSDGPGAYAKRRHNRRPSRIMTEEEVFDDEAPHDEGKGDEEDGKERDNMDDAAK